MRKCSRIREEKRAGSFCRFVIVGEDCWDSESEHAEINELTLYKENWQQEDKDATYNG